MRYIKLGTTGLDVSPIAIGAMTYGEPGRGHPVWSKGEAEARPLIKHALAAGINFFDTANMYSQRLQRGDPRPRAEGLRRPRRGGHRHEAAPPDAPGPQRPRPVRARRS